MNTTWLEIIIPAPAFAVDLICHAMVELGSQGVTIEERQLDTFIMPDPDENSPDHFRLKAYFPNADAAEQLLQQVAERLQALRALLPNLPSIEVELHPVRQQDWAEDWKQHFGVTRIGRRLVIKPTWEDFTAEAADAVVTLDPGMAFGTGTHDTTRLCLEALAQLFDQEPRQRVLDVGTGSGILAIAAAALGAQQVVACDIEPQSCLVATENARLNGVDSKVQITGQPLDDLEGNFQLVLANILAEENIRLAPQLVSRLAPGGSLVLSGILVEKEQLVIDALRAFALSGPQIDRTAEWSCLIYRKET
ncbi:MAG: ribosomal protein L11 methyltransferase [Desulfuromonadales bacterium C00003094]|jgi:ribosomal protein L11 methyltransferase|nr:MAG: ribosomal protein L11 methyltransferase [Desulfuromonadales bacterium C00003094]OEU75142.1 MAG: ribosomal protein L11 methyltransferase [Desulfuromonadales bacterium C00003107]